MIPTVVSKLVKVSTSQSQENFDLQDSVEKAKNASVSELIVAVITFIVVLIILAFIGMFLWNAVIAGADKGSGIITCARKATSVWQILGLYILVGLIFGK
tara:strand:+ start:1408 stop:1707 length:300 start_codon:yes stop_codon:yes gene_type:complete